MDFSFTKEQEQLREEFETFFKEEMKHAPKPWLSEYMFSREDGFAFHQRLKKKLGEKGWLSRAWPKEYGGQDAPLIEQFIFNEAHAKYHAPGVDYQGLLMLAPTLLAGGSEEQKKKWLPPIARGEVQYCQGWSEPNAGSDLANISTMAVKDGDCYVVNGQKTWTSAAHCADHMFLLARTDPESTRSRGLSVFQLRMDLPGIDVRPILDMDGEHVFNDVYFNDVHIPASNLIGVENEGWALTRQTMNFERSGVANFITGKGTLRELIEYTKNTKRNGKPLSENPIFRKKFAELYTSLEIGHAYTYKINWEQDKGNLLLSVAASSMSKVLGAELRQRIANISTETLGLYGQLKTSKWAPFYGQAAAEYQSCIGSNVAMGMKWAPFYGQAAAEYQSCIGSNVAMGSNEIQRNLIAWIGLGLPRV